MKKKELPELTDALAESLGENLKTVAELRTRISENLEAQAEAALRRSLEEKLVSALVDGAEFVIPPMTIEHEAEHVLEDQQRQLARYNIDFENYLQGMGKSTEEVVEEAKGTAELRLKRFLVIDSMVESEAMAVSDEEIAAEVAVLKESSEHTPEELDTDEMRDTVRRILLRRTTMDRVFESMHRPGATDMLTASRATAPAGDDKAAVAGPAAATKTSGPARVKTPRRADRTDK